MSNKKNIKYVYAQEGCLIIKIGILFLWFKEVYFTGSNPLPPQGWQRKIRFSAIQLPLKAPYLFTASKPYCEQEGVKRHDGFNRGEIAYW